MSIAETLKELRNIQLGQQIEEYTDHKRLIYKTFNTEQAMQWRLIFEEYSPELIYIQGFKNVAADALSRLDTLDNSNPVPNNITSVNEYYGQDISYPTNYETVIRN